MTEVTTHQDSENGEHAVERVHGEVAARYLAHARDAVIPAEGADTRNLQGAGKTPLLTSSSEQ